MLELCAKLLCPLIQYATQGAQKWPNVSNGNASVLLELSVSVGFYPCRSTYP